MLRAAEVLLRRGIVRPHAARRAGRGAAGQERADLGIVAATTAGALARRRPAHLAAARPVRRAVRRAARAQGRHARAGARRRRRRVLLRHDDGAAEGLADGMVSGRRAHHGGHHPAGLRDHQDPARTPRSSPRCSSCAWPTGCSSTATARSTPTRTPSSSPTSPSRRPAPRPGSASTPRVAMLSYSTGNSGAGADVDKVRAATALVRERRPDLLVEGPIQYDAAVDARRSRPPSCPARAVAGPGDRAGLPRPEHRQQHLQGRAALGRRGRGRPGAAGAAQAGQRPVARRARPGHRQHRRDHRDPGPGERPRDRPAAAPATPGHPRARAQLRLVVAEVPAARHGRPRRLAVGLVERIGDRPMAGARSWRRLGERERRARSPTTTRR